MKCPCCPCALFLKHGVVNSYVFGLNAGLGFFYHETMFKKGFYSTGVYDKHAV